MAKFQNVSCSHCGQEFGPGDHGYSHCDDHPGWKHERKLRRERARAGLSKGARQTVGGDGRETEKVRELAAPQPMRQFDGTPIFARGFGGMEI